MITARDAFYYSLVVRRVSTGSTPFRWEVHRMVGIELAQVSSERFRSMQAAYEAGQAWLTAFLALPVSDALRSITLSADDDDDDAFSDQDEDIDLASDALDKDFMGTAAPVYPSSVG